MRIHVGNVPEGAIVPPPTRNTIIGNRMFRNGTDDPEEIVLGIDLGADGITANDPGDPGNPDANPPVSPSLPDDDNGPNNLLNFPVVSFADCSPETELCSSAEIDVSPLPAGTFRIEVFENGGCDPSGHGEGEKRIGFLNATVDGSADPPPLLLALDPSLDPSEVVLTSTATDSDGNTSEFSACAGVTEIVVNSREDDPLKEDSLICDTGDQAFKERTGEVECTLRAAIELANKRVGQDTISFDIQEGSVPYLIQPESALPEISTPMVIDATTQQGFAASSAARGALFGWKTDLVTPATETCPLASPVVQIEGAQAGEETSGLTVTGGNTSILGLAIVSFTANGIQLKGGGNNIVDLNYLGTDGFEDLGNTERGLFIEESDGNRVGLVDDPLAILAGCLPRNVISGNRFQGVYVVRSEENRIEGNQIGTDTFGPTALPNSNGVAVFDSTRTTIRGNLISGNQRNGVQIVSSINGLSFDNSVVANMIGTDLSGEFPLGNTDAGVEIQNSSDNKITGNLISANEDRGIGIVGKQSTGNRVRLNFIGTDRSGGCEFDNGACPLGNGANFSSGPTAGGIVLWAGASSNDIGGETAGDRNIISGNHGPGVRLWLADTSANVIGANFIGFDALGNSLGNTGSGVEIEEATGTVVGGPNDGAQELFPGNRIARNGLGGISIENGSSTLVLGNLIQSNARDGLLMINAVDSFIGGANNEDDRIVSGNIFVDNGEFGVRIIGEDSFNNTVLN